MRHEPAKENIPDGQGSRYKGLGVGTCLPCLGSRKKATEWEREAGLEIDVAS